MIIHRIIRRLKCNWLGDFKWCLKFVKVKWAKYVCSGVCTIGGLCASVLYWNYICPEAYNEDVTKCINGYNRCMNKKVKCGDCNKNSGPVREIDW